MKLTRQQILNLHNGLHSVGNLAGVKFAYAVSRNLSKIKSEIEALQKSYEPSPEFLVYEKERVELAEEHAEKIDNKPKKVVENGNERFVIEDKGAFNKKLEILRKKHKVAIKARETQIKSFDDLLKEEIEIDLYKVDIKHVPKEVTAKQMNDIFIIVEEDLTN